MPLKSVKKNKSIKKVTRRVVRKSVASKKKTKVLKRPAKRVLKKVTKKVVKKTIKRSRKRVVKKVVKRATKRAVRKVVKKVIRTKRALKKTNKQNTTKKKATTKKISKETKVISEEENKALEGVRVEKSLYKKIPSKYRKSIKKMVEKCREQGYVTTDVLMEHINLHECDRADDVWLCIEGILEHNCIDKIETTGWLQEFKTKQDPRFPDFEKMPYDSVQMYLKDIGKYDLLSPAEEQELAKQVFNRNALINKLLVQLKKKNPEIMNEIRDESDRKKVLAIYKKKYKNKLSEKDKRVLEVGAFARNKLATANLRLVAHIAKSYTRRSRDLTLLDLVQEGADGLYKAVDGFDYRKGYKFSTYATWWIRQSVNRGLLDKSKTIRIPVHMHETIQKYNTVNVQLGQDLGRPPTVEEIATELGETTEKVYTIRAASQSVLKLDRPQWHGDEEGGTTIAETHTDDEQETPDMVASQEILQEQLKSILKDLSLRERQVVELRHGMYDGVQYTLEQIGRKLGVTRERVRQIESKALEKLRAHDSLEKLESYK